jgi:CRISPR system Cascade subunit CasB
MDDPHALREALARLAFQLARLDPGPLARLRRAEPGEPPADFWRLWHGGAWPGRPEKLKSEDWEWVVTAFAIVTPTGAPDGKLAPHDASVPLGRALHAAGISEARVAALLNTPFDLRRPLILRLCRTLAAKRQAMDMRDLGELLLRPHAPLRKLADTYYAADAAAAKET